jgi:hypothetical protein
MSVSLTLEIVSVDEADKDKDIVTATVASDQLALLLLDWRNAYLSHSHVLSDAEKAILKATFSQRSQSVTEGIETFAPSVVSIENLLSVLIKLRKQYLHARLNEEIKKQGQYEIKKLVFDIMAISECIGVLELMQVNAQHAYIAILDS